jgi:hypothetical protein
MHKRLLIPFLGLLLMTLVFLPKGADALTISPPYFDYSLNPGDTVLDVIKLYNEGSWPETYYPIVMNFGAADDEAGTPQFYSAEEDAMGRGLAQWITVDTAPITIQPQERVNLQFSINIPKGETVQPGGHYGAILMSTEPPTIKGSGVGVSSQLSSIMLVRVSGEVREVGSIAEFGFSNPQVWFNHLPVDFFMRFENSGNVHLRPTGNLIIENWYGRDVANVKVNSEFRSVLPMSIRKFDFGWTKVDENSLQTMSSLEKELKNFALGKYTARLVLNYGSTNQVLTDVREFYVWPWRLLTIFGVGLLILLVAGFNFKRSYDKSLLRRFELLKKQSDRRRR